MASLPELIERARALTAERDRLEEALARQWVSAFKDQPLSAEDLEEFWAGLTEDAIRWLLKHGQTRWPPETVQQEALGVIRRVRERVERALAETDESVNNA